jgi:hypothetical protein
MVRNVLRQDIEDQLRKSPMAMFFDNTFVLVTLFGLVIVAGYYLSLTTMPDPATRLAEAEKIFSGDPSPAWLTTRDEILLPLIDENAFPDRNADLKYLVEQANQHEFCRRLKISTPSDGSSQSEVERLIRRGFDSYAAGDVAEAQGQLEAVLKIIEDDRQYACLIAFLTNTLSEWHSDRDVMARRQFVESVWDEANRYSTLPDGREQAVRMLQAAIRLYQNDAAVEAPLTKCRELLQQLSAAEKTEVR